MNDLLNLIKALAAGTATAEQVAEAQASGFATKAGKLSKQGNVLLAAAPKGGTGGATHRETEDQVKAWIRDRLGKGDAGTAKLLREFRDTPGRHCNQERFRGLVAAVKAEPKVAPRKRSRRGSKAAA